MTNPWHDVSYGDKSPEIIDIIIEIPKGSSVKYEIDKDTGLLRLDRVLYSAVHYPGDYGFMPQTLWDDGDPLDVIVISSHPVYPMTIASVRPIGVIHMEDGGEGDDKIIAVYHDDPKYKDYKDLNDASSHVIDEITHFFETYKLLQKKSVKILSTEGAEAAKEAVLKAIKLYKDKYSKN
ncbi:MAG TPA: inorganic diphosphatase [Alphaproteobacteria bacterium]|nr:inorganic diphosphatase [Alphaproteobacteria bacterium]